jgi:hypothetical protein
MHPFVTEGSAVARSHPQLKRTQSFEIAECYPAFYDVSDALTGLAFTVNWIGLAECRIQEICIRDFDTWKMPMV